MAKRLTKSVQYVRLPEKRIHEIEELVATWSYETKAFMRARLNQYHPPSGMLNSMLEFLLSVFMSAPERKFTILKDPQILTDWQKRFEISGQTKPQDAWNKILEKEVSARDYTYLLSLLNKELGDIHVPNEMAALFEKIYRAHIRKEYLSDPGVPNAPLLLIIGPSGSGKTATVKETIEQIIFVNEVLPEIDLKQKQEELLADEPFWQTIDKIDPTLADEIARRKRLRFYKRVSGIPLIRWLFKNRISKQLSELEEQSILVDYAMVTPNDYQTALAGEPGNYFKKAMGDPRRITIRHIEEAHSAFGKSSGRESSGVDHQQRTLIDTANIIIDEITSGRRDCLLIATTDQPERIDTAIYRRFVEKGRIIDINENWKDPGNLREIVRLELLRNNIRIADGADGRCHAPVTCLAPERLDQAVEKINTIFAERTLKITPSYVRKLVSSVIEIKGDFLPEHLGDSLLVRRAFELVAQNSHGNLFNKVVDHMDRGVKWDEYAGDIKNVFSEMANNCLFYEVSEEKGVVLNGPPGSGKTFLIRSWLSENRGAHDMAISPITLQDPINPIDGAVANLEKVYDIAKMIAPTVIFIDEGDSLAPKRSSSGGSPSDKLTNKFLNLIDGEIPLNRVFTVLTTNRLDILDPALIRSKRLKVMEVSGHLNKEDITKIIERTLGDVPLSNGVNLEGILDAARGICNTPADYTAFVEKARSLRGTEHRVLQKLQALVGAGHEEKNNFIKFNFKTLIGILDALDVPRNIRTRIKSDPNEFINHFDAVLNLLDHINPADGYPLMKSHLSSARKEISQSPVKKGKVQLDEFLEAELSQEPQVGFIIGVGASDVAGVLLPIATSLNYSLSSEKVLVTGAVSSSSPAAAEMDLAVQMTQQSAQEALTMVQNYFQALSPKISIARLFGEFLEKFTIHHQLLSASYNVGGPSAGYALALNTLSALLHIPIYHDFGITGAPWTKGVKKDEVGGSVIIGGHKKKTEKVLLHLRRMYMPLQNYRDLELDFLFGYWLQNKDILGVSNFGDLVPELIWLGPDYEKTLLALISMRLEYKLKKYKDLKQDQPLKEKILAMKADLRGQAEKELISRLEAIRRYLRNPGRDPHLSMEEIFKQQYKNGLPLRDALRGLIRGRKKERLQTDDAAL
ncbi:MAG: AAA family ATPase [Desulfobacterales bacterium]|nr:MAG: AAA family ATPase [Desulfobacterales bacterium]